VLVQFHMLFVRPAVSIVVTLCHVCSYFSSLAEHLYHVLQYDNCSSLPPEADETDEKDKNTKHDCDRRDYPHSVWNAVTCLIVSSE